MSRWEALRGRSIELLYRKDVKVTRAPIAGEILRGFGFDVRVIVEEEAELSRQQILFVGGNPLWYRRALSRVEGLPEDERPVVIVWHTEPLPMPRAAKLPREPLTLREVAKIVLRDRRINDYASNGRYLRTLDRRGIVSVLAVATGAYQAYLAENGVKSEFVPVGYHADDGRLLGLERDIDVLFLGDYGIRRRRRILASLEREGLDVLVTGSHSPTKGYWGEARTELVNRAKILLNLPRLQGHLPDIRLIVGMANGALVVSEPLHLPAPFVPGVHYVESDVDNLGQTLRRYLADDVERMWIAAAGHKLVTQGLTLDDSFAKLLDLAAVRLIGDGSA